MTPRFEKLLKRARKIGGRVQLFETHADLWTAGIYFHGGRKYEWASRSGDPCDALEKAIEFAEKEARNLEDDYSDLA